MALAEIGGHLGRCYSSCAADVLRVCVVGSGVAGFSTAQQLIKRNSNARVDVIEKLPVPFGLLRYGVAPDHADVKNCANYLTRIAKLPNCRFIGNITFGKDISLPQLQALYHAVVLAYGAEEDCKLGIPGEDLPGVYSARDFFSWYNGLPKCKDLNPDLSGEVAVVIGQGNVALDVARILLTPTQLLEHTDICDHALRALRESRIRRVYLIGRQGPLQVSFSTKELRTMSGLPGCTFRSDQQHFKQVKTILRELPRPKRRQAEFMMKAIDLGGEKRNYKEWYLHFKRTPVKMVANTSSGRVASVQLQVNKLEGDWSSSRAVGTGKYEDLPCSMVLRSTGYRTLRVPGVPFDDNMRVIPNTAGRVIGKSGAVVSGLYCSGWVKTGPVGAILNTMSSAYETAECIIQDYNADKLKNRVTKNDDILHILSSLSGAFPTSFSDWKLIDNIERSRVNEAARQKVKPREKIVSFDEMIGIIRSNGGGWLKS